MKIQIIIAVLLVSFTCLAHPGFPARPHRPIPSPHAAHHMGHHHGRSSAPSFIGGLVGGLVGSTLFRPTETVVVQQPVAVPARTVVVQPQPAVVVSQQIWVDGRYEDRLLNGNWVRVWVPGHYETVQP